MELKGTKSVQAVDCDQRKNVSQNIVKKDPVRTKQNRKEYDKITVEPFSLARAGGGNIQNFSPVPSRDKRS